MQRAIHQRCRLRVHQWALPLLVVLQDAGVEPVPCLRQPLSLPWFNCLLLRWPVPVPRLFDLPSPTEGCCAEGDSSTMLVVCPPLGGAGTGCSASIEGNPILIVIVVVLL